MQPECHFLDPEKPLGLQSATWLLERAAHCGDCPDLGDWGVVVPTAESGRVLAALLTRLVPRQAVLLPRILTPVQVLRGPHPDEGTATGPERLMAWCEVLCGLDFAKPSDRCEAVFPSVPPVQDVAWALGVARLFLDTQDTLMEAGCGMGDVLRRLPQVREADRWETLAGLEARYREVLRKWNLVDPLEAWKRLEAFPAWDALVAHWAVIGVPDPLPMACRVLAATTHPVHCLVHAREDRAADFDNWGRPLPFAWKKKDLPIAAPEERLHLLLDESGLAAAAASLVRAHRRPASAVVGICREEILPRLRQTLEDDGLAVHDPSGQPAAAHGLSVLLATLHDLLEDRSLTALRTLLTHPGGRRALLANDDHGSPTPWLEALDRHESRHLSRTLDDLLELPDGPGGGGAIRAATAARDWCSRLTGSEGLDALKAWILAAMEQEIPDEAGRDLLETLDEWIERVRPVQDRMRHLRLPHLLRLWVDALAGQRLPGTRDPRAVELKGWLELAWDERPHLVLCGIQEGSVPPALSGDVFLPESLRASLGLRTSDELLARDAFLLHGMLASRSRGGRVDLLLSKFTDAGEPLRPSRLLLQTADGDLPARVRLLFGDASGSPATPAPTRLFHLKLPTRDPAKKHISVTQFSDFLQSPLYFHLNRSLKWEAYPRDKREMDALDFGDLAHQTLEAWGKDPGLSTATDPSAMRAFFEQDLRRRADQRYGPSWPLGVEVQIAALGQRLGRFAELQAAERADGWTVHAIEHPFEIKMRDWTVRGKIDRIDVHPDGRIRLLDYKTSESAKAPRDAHLKQFKRAPERTRFPEAAWWENGTGAAIWLNLQLPLYVAYWRQAHGGDRLQCGYIQLPNPLESVAFSIWDDFGPELEQAALSCAGAVLEALDRGDRSAFPSADCWKREPWSVWFPDGPEAIFLDEATGGTP
ncbi:MAG: PD-(D/E)XK nuclease family protein [Candidatus Methylacidiphilales bacterium]|nr:PD-(D/E)XK nuclease family protein [Candidatus Methylacidiphilales bacterium]